MSAPKRIKYKGQIYEAVEIRPLSDILKNKDLSVIVVPDARDFDIHEWERMISAEEDDDMAESLLEEDEKISGEKFTVAKDDVQNILNKIASSDQFVAPYYKTRGFMKANNLSTDDVKAIVSQLTPSDYNHSVTSKVFKPGDVLTVFITNKDFEVNGKKLYGSKLYIKVDADYGDMVAIVSIHTDEKHKNSRLNPYSSDTDNKSGNKPSTNESYDSVSNRIYKYFKWLMWQFDITNWSYNDPKVHGDDFGGGMSTSIMWDGDLTEERVIDILSESSDFSHGFHFSKSRNEEWEHCIRMRVDEYICKTNETR